MSIIGNILWVVLGGGILIFVEYVIAGVALCLTIVGIPFGFQCCKLAVLALLPFGREVVTKPPRMGILAVILNIVWIALAGIPLVITHLALAVLLAVTIIGIPFAVQHLKLMRLAFTPFGLEVK